MKIRFQKGILRPGLITLGVVYVALLVVLPWFGTLESGEPLSEMIVVAAKLLWPSFLMSLLAIVGASIYKE